MARVPIGLLLFFGIVGLLAMGLVVGVVKAIMEALADRWASGPPREDPFWEAAPLKMPKRYTRYMPPEVVAEIDHLHGDEHRERNEVRFQSEVPKAWDGLAGYRDPALIPSDGTIREM